MSILRNHLRFGLRCQRRVFYPIRSKYVVLLPEIPPDTPQDNVLLQDTTLPRLGELTAEQTSNALSKHALNFECGFWSLEDQLKDQSTPRTFSSIISQIDILESPLSNAFHAVNLFYMNNSDAITSEIYQKLLNRGLSAKVLKFQSKELYQTFKKIKSTEKDLSDVQHRVLDKYLIEAKLNGIELEPNKSEGFYNTIKILENYKSIFRRRADAATERFSMQISNKMTVSECPESLLKEMTVDGYNHETGPWKVSLHSNVYDEFMKYCSNREIRQQLWRGMVTRCSNQSDDRDVVTNDDINNIRQVRARQAILLGYEDFGQLSMETKMAGSTDNVYSLISTLLVRGKKSQIREIKSLQKFAEERGFMDSLEAHDIPYWRRKQCEDTYNYFPNKLSEYFQFEHVWSQLLLLCSQLFQINFEEITPDMKIVWHEDVRLFRVLDNDGSLLGHLFLDPFMRSEDKLVSIHESAWSLTLKNRSDAANHIPINALIFNFNQSTQEGIPSLLSFNEVNLLFKKFGEALQHILTTIPYADASGRTNIEWDCTDVASKFMQNWLCEPSILERISQHYQSEQPLSESSIEDLINGKNHLAGYDLCKQLYFSHLDMILNTSDVYYYTLVKELWDKYHPYQLKNYDAHVCSMRSIMTDIWSAAYFSHVWSNMIAANVFMTFKNAESNEELEQIGKKYRDTYLALGGGCHQYEVFRKFCGRDPAPENLHDVIGIKE